MGEDPTTGEIGRAIADMRQDNRDEHERLRRGLNHKLDREVYEADLRRWDDRYQALGESIRQQQRDNDNERKAFQEWREKRDAARKWIIGALILPLGGILVEIIDLIRSTH